MNEAEVTRLIDLTPTETVTHTFVRDVRLPSGRVLALVTLDNGLGPRRPATLGPRGLLELADALDELATRAAERSISGVAITGVDGVLAAGADLGLMGALPDKSAATTVARLGHYALGKLATLGVPSFAFINGTALGGGLEVALNAHYRTVSSAARNMALPETYLGLVPGWGGAFLLPNLIGVDKALNVIIDNPARNNRMLDARQIKDLGIADEMFGSVRFIEDSLEWADRVIGGEIVSRPYRPGKVERTVTWDAAVALKRKEITDKVGVPSLSVTRALDLVAAAKDDDRDAAFIREDEALSDMIVSDQFRASLYGFTLINKHAKSPHGAPDAALARPIRKVGVIGAGLMASQFAMLFARRLGVPVIITDVSQDRIDKGLSYMHGEMATLHSRGAVTSDELNRFAGMVSGTVDIADFHDCDLVIEAVFEELGVKQDVFRRVEHVISADAILATNTSSLSVADMASVLQRPERLVGFHFFNPVAVMPLVEIVNAPETNDITLATALSLARSLRKTAVITSDATGFVVNRLLGVFLGEAMRAFDNGTEVDTIIEAMAPLGLPMNAFVLLDLIGLKVGAHVLDSMAGYAPERFYTSRNLHALADGSGLFDRDDSGKRSGFSAEAVRLSSMGTQPSTTAQVYGALVDSLAREVRIMLDENVVHSAEDIDLCMILGAGWPLHLGGLTPYLDRCGASQRTFGGTFHTPPIRGAASS
ncbi:MAG: hypothetical protein RL431_192 [Actinomycetota bacterium]|jgi:3-hydroxyacyl-CoA dehydrogenase/enoyl-CoA hydratase/carnithine racemase